jgi:hypothetical protein
MPIHTYHAVPLPRPCHDPATTLPFSDSAVSVKVPYLVHEVLLLSPSRKYLLLNCYNLCAVNYTSTHVLAPKISFFSSITNAALFHTGHLATASEIGMLLITNCLELGVVAARGRKLASREHAVNMPSPCGRDPAMNLPWP